MEPKFYVFRDRPRHKYDIILFPEQVPTSENEDVIFFDWFRTFIARSPLSRKTVDDILLYHSGESKVTLKEFVEHTKLVFERHENEFRYKTYALGYAFEWIKEKQKEIPILPKKRTKKNPSFEQIVRDKEKMDIVLKTLRSKGLIDEDFTWRMGKIDLIALIQGCLENKIIHDKGMAELGRVFSEKFKCKMNARMFSAVIKQPTINKILDELPFLETPKFARFPALPKPRVL